MAQDVQSVIKITSCTPTVRYPHTFISGSRQHIIQSAHCVKPFRMWQKPLLGFISHPFILEVPSLLSMLFPSPGSVLSTLHGQGQVVVSGVRFLMGPFQHESHRLWSSPSLQRDRGQYSEAERLRQWSLRVYEGCFMRIWPNTTILSDFKMGWVIMRERERHRWGGEMSQSPLSMTSRGWKVSISCSTSLRPVMFYSWLMRADLDWAMICTDWHGSAPFSKANSCEDWRSSLAHHLPVSHSFSHGSAFFSWDVFGAVHKVWLLHF